jgi:hypothetical protein
MTPKEFLDEIVVPNIDEFKVNFSSLRHAYNAISSVDALAAHLYWWLKNTGVDLKETDDSAYRKKLSDQSSDFRLLRDIAKAQKHVELKKHNPEISKASQVESKQLGWGDGSYGQGHFGGVQQVVVKDNNNELHYIEEIVNSALNFLTSEMQKHGLNS